MTMTLEQSFAEAAKKVTESNAQEAERWAGWILTASIEMTHPRDVLWSKEAESEHWSKEQADVLRYLLNTEDMVFSELEELILAIGDVDGIWSLCFSHICWMYGCSNFSEGEEIDEFLKMVDECSLCGDGACLYAYQFAVTEMPLSFVQCQEMAHHDIIWGYISHVEQMLDPLVNLHKNFVVRAA